MWQCIAAAWASDLIGMQTRWGAALQRRRRGFAVACPCSNILHVCFVHVHAHNIRHTFTLSLESEGNCSSYVLLAIETTLAIAARFAMKRCMADIPLS